ncbi:DUF3800 domain-containing protein [Kitasatospora sp. NPDC004272]
MSSYLIYTDDSGDEKSSFFTALLIPMEKWPVTLRQWLKFRKWMYARHQVPTDYEWHTYEWLKGTGRPDSNNPDNLINTSVHLRREVCEKALKAIKAIGAQQGVGLLTCEMCGPVKADAYAATVRALDSVLEERNAHGVIIVDGGDHGVPDPNVRAAHRDLKLHSRRVIEDGWLQPAHASQLVQMADLVAHVAYQSTRRKPSRKFMWDWYREYLHAMELECRCP